MPTNPNRVRQRRALSVPPAPADTLNALVKIEVRLAETLPTTDNRATYRRGEGVVEAVIAEIARRFEAEPLSIAGVGSVEFSVAPGLGYVINTADGWSLRH